MIIPTLDKTYDLATPQLIRKLFEYFIISDYSQTFYYVGEVASLKYLIGNYEGDELTTKIESVLEIMYRRYFERLPKYNSLFVEASLTGNDSNGIIELVINIEVVIDNKKNTLSQSINVKEVDSLVDGGYIDELNMVIPFDI